jgi:hypothetical protein
VTDSDALGAARTRAERYWDEELGPQLSATGVPADAVAYSRENYVKAVLANQKAMDELREMYPDV